MDFLTSLTPLEEKHFDSFPVIKPNEISTYNDTNALQFYKHVERKPGYNNVSVTYRLVRTHGFLVGSKVNLKPDFFISFIECMRHAKIYDKLNPEQKKNVFTLNSRQSALHFGRSRVSFKVKELTDDDFRAFFRAAKDLESPLYGNFKYSHEYGYLSCRPENLVSYMFEPVTPPVFNPLT